MRKTLRNLLLVLATMLLVAQLVQAAETWFSNQGGIVNTRHNLTQSPAMGDTARLMDNYRSNYGEVCVYCHTPHGANASVTAPLWNRNIKANDYTTYDKLGTTTLTQTVYQPGAASLMCLSCHDGQQAVDAIMNMPGSGGYSANPDNAFLDTWAARGGNEAYHQKLNAINFSSFSDESCMICHSPGAGLGKFATDFTLAAIGTDLRNDHPVGVKFPATTGDGTDWKTPNASVARGAVISLFFDDNGNGRLDKSDIRLYDSGNGPVVECASCHDPHGVPSAGAGSKFNPTFLRKTNENSIVCLTCHSK
jgi:mono/diheme cytochrome c family protein